MEEEEGKQQFQRLKPFCINLMNQKDQLTLSRLYKEITSMSNISSSLLEYILLPLRITLQQCALSNDSLLEATLSCVGVVLSKTCISAEGTFHELLLMLCLMIDTRTPPEGSKLSKFGGCGLKSEEMMCVVLKDIRILLLNSTNHVLLSLYTDLPSLGHAISVITNIIQSNNNRQSIIEAIHTLISLSHVDSTQWKQLIVSGCTITNIGQSTIAGYNSFTSFLPGIAICLSKIATNNGLIGKDVIMLSILGWSHYVAMVMCDSEDDTTPTITSNTELVIKRSKIWFKDTDSHLSKLCSRIAGLVTHDDWLVRLSLCIWAKTILQYCYRSITITIGPVIEVIVSLLSDEYKTVSLNASNILTDCVNIIESNSVSDLSCLLEEKLYKLISELPRLMRGADENKKKVLLKLLHGYLTILGSHVYHMTSSIEYVSRLIHALAQTIQLDNNQTQIITEQKWVWFNQDEDIWIPPISYVHIREEGTILIIQSICALLGKYGQIDCLFNYILEQITMTTNLRSELLLITHMILGGVKLITPINNIINGLLLITEDGPLYDYTNCFLLNIFGDCSRILQKQFIKYLQHVVIIILEYINNTSVLVANTALLTARQICKYMEYCNLPNLIIDCADYLIDHVTTSFTHYNSITISGFNVLQAVIMCGSYSVLPVMFDCIESLLLLLDQWYGIKHCWDTIHCLANRLQEWITIETTNTLPITNMPLTEPNDISLLPDKEHIDDINDIATYFINHNNKQTQQQNNNDQQGEPITADKPIPPAIQCAINIIQRSTHHLSSSNELIRLCVLDSLQLSITALNGVDEKIYLPDIHIMWSSFVHCLNDSHLPSRTKAITVLHAMVELCGAFLRKRVIEEVWPRLIQTLEEPILPINNDTLQYKLLITTINIIPQLCTKLDVDSTDCERIVHYIIPYIQIHCLQSLCIDTLILLANYNNDLIWLLMIQLITEELPYHHTPLTCYPIKLPVCVSGENVQELIKTVLVSTI